MMMVDPRKGLKEHYAHEDAEEERHRVDPRKGLKDNSSGEVEIRFVARMVDPRKGLKV